MIASGKIILFCLVAICLASIGVSGVVGACSCPGCTAFSLGSREHQARIYSCAPGYIATVQLSVTIADSSSTFDVITMPTSQYINYQNDETYSSFGAGTASDVDCFQSGAYIGNGTQESNSINVVIKCLNYVLTCDLQASMSAICVPSDKSHSAFPPADASCSPVGSWQVGSASTKLTTFTLNNDTTAEMVTASNTEDTCSNGTSPCVATWTGSWQYSSTSGLLTMGYPACTVKDNNPCCSCAKSTQTCTINSWDKSCGVATVSCKEMNSTYSTESWLRSEASAKSTAVLLWIIPGLLFLHICSWSPELPSRGSRLMALPTNERSAQATTKQTEKPLQP